MRIAFLVFNLNGMGGTSRSVITQANALAGGHEIQLVSVTRSGEAPHYDIDPRIAVDYLVHAVPGEPPATVAGLVDAGTASRLEESESLLVPSRWDHQFSALTDVALEDALPKVRADVLVTVTPALLAAAVQLVASDVAVVHQEHRSSSDRTATLEPLLSFAPRADAVVVLTDSMATWLEEQLGAALPTTLSMPNPLPVGHAPRSRLDTGVIVAAGRLVREKQFGKLIAAFAEIADQIPGWRLRIFGDGPQRPELRRLVRAHQLWDRVELPGSTTDMRSEWAKASISALTSRAEGFPLVAQEAMAAGVPVASFDCAAGPREIIEHEVNGLLVAPDSVPGMAAALLRLATDDQLRSKLGAGRRTVDAALCARRPGPAVGGDLQVRGQPSWLPRRRAAAPAPHGGLDHGAARRGAAQPRRPRRPRRRWPGARPWTGRSALPAASATPGSSSRPRLDDVDGGRVRCRRGTLSSASWRRATGRRTSPSSTPVASAGRSDGDDRRSSPATSAEAARRA